MSDETQLLEKVQEEALKALNAEKENLANELVEKLKGYATNETVESFKTLAENTVNKEQLEAVKSVAEDIELRLKRMEETPKSPEVKDGILEYLKSVPEDIKDFKNNKSKSFKAKIALKNFSIGDSLLPTDDGIPFIPIDYKPNVAETPDTRERFNILQYVNVGSTISETVSWMEEESETGAALFIDECVAKPEVSKAWKRNKATVQKVADFSKVCDEVLLYIPRMRQLIEQFLRKLVNISIQEAILSGDGTGDNLLGIIPQATAFVAGTKAASVRYANYFDAIRASASQIKCLGYMPDIALVNCDDLFQFESIKDENGQYLSASLGGVRLVECPFITPGEFLVGDFSMSNVDFFKGITSEWDRNGEDFRENAISVRSEAFLVHYIAANNVGAFIYDTFANVVTLIDKP